MPDQIQLRGGSANDNDSFSGAQREVTVDTTNNTLRVHDGTTTGGHPLVQGTASTEADGDTVIKRDEWGRAQVANPVDDADIANKGWVTGQIGDSGYFYRQTLVFTADDDFVKADFPWLKGMRIRGQAPGGGGGGAAATTGSQVAVGASGGGGTYAEKWIDDISALDASIPITVGSPGSGGTAGANAGTAGGTMSFGTLLTIPGGGGGSGAVAAGSTGFRGGPGGANGGGAATGHDLQVLGGQSDHVLYWSNTLAMTVRPGGSLLGEPLRSAYTSSGFAGQIGQAFGAGGTGAVNCESQSARAGGNGGAPIMLIDLYA